jgi:hypothetical protein
VNEVEDNCMIHDDITFLLAKRQQFLLMRICQKAKKEKVKSMELCFGSI